MKNFSTKIKKNVNVSCWTTNVDMNEPNLTCYYLHKTSTFEYYIQILAPQGGLVYIANSACARSQQL